jgi:hypothetical protein
MACKGIHNKYKRTRRVGNSNYSDKIKRCTTCEVFLEWSGLLCPCCGYKLRTSPRSKNYKAKLKDQLKNGT